MVLEVENTMCEMTFGIKLFKKNKKNSTSQVNYNRNGGAEHLHVYLYTDTCIYISVCVCVYVTICACFHVCVFNIVDV